MNNIRQMISSMEDKKDKKEERLTMAYRRDIRDIMAGTINRPIQSSKKEITTTGIVVTVFTLVLMFTAFSTML